MKILTFCTPWIMAVHISAQLLWSFQQKPEKAKHHISYFVVYFKVMKHLRIYIYTHIYTYAALSLCWQLMWENYKNIHHLCEEYTLVLGQWAARQSGPDELVFCIYCFEGILFSFSAVGLNSLLKVNALFHSWQRNCWYHKQ